VTIVEMKPDRFTPAHGSPLFAELVCSNSLKSDEITNASGLLKAEMRELDSLIMRAADASRVPAGTALAVDRERFASYITDALEEHPLVSVDRREAVSLPEPPAIIATGPLTAQALSEALGSLPGLRKLSFFDAAAPILERESLSEERVFAAARYGHGGADYLNCPLAEPEYDAFRDALLAAQTAPVRGFEEGLLYEGCMPVESIAARGRLALAYGPMRPVGLIDPRTGRRPFAAVQLRAENEGGALWNMVGFQTRLKWDEQRRVFGMIPGLERARFARYGVMHRNTFIDAPSALSASFETRERRGLYIAGQLTGVEGYLPSAASGLAAGIALSQSVLGREPVTFPPFTAIGALGRYVSSPNRDYQPMGIQYGIIDMPRERFRDKRERARRVAERSLEAIRSVERTLRERRGVEV
jgi:methylenetetrahydrofolate--tRNA-(uracil-5-)-methyltransferase